MPSKQVSVTSILMYLGFVAFSSAPLYGQTSQQMDSVKIAPPVQEITVSGKRNPYKRERVSSASRITTPLIETPQNIIVLDNQVFQDQQMFSPQELSRNISGVSVIFPFPTIYTDFNIRGTRATQSKFRNGISTSGQRFGMLMEDMSYVESVEFIKGPAGFMIGQGEPGGLYNVITKKPTQESIRSTNVSFGSFGLFRGSVDFGGKITDDAKLSYRLNSIIQRANTHVDFQINNRFSIAPALQYDFSPNATIMLELNYDEAQTRNGDPSIPSVNGQFVLPRNFSSSDPGIADPIQLRHTFGYGQFQYRFDNTWKATAQIGISDGFWQGYDIAIQDSVRANNSVTRQARYNDQRTNNVSGQAFLNGIFKTGDIEHNLLIGIDAGVQQFRRINITRNGVFPITNVFSPNYNATQLAIDTLLRVANQSFPPPETAAWEALYVQNSLKLIPQVILTLAVRYNNIRSGSTLLKRDEAFSPRFGITLMPIENLSIYGLFDQSLIPLAGRTFAGEEFRPLRGVNFEAGAKYELFEGKLSASAAYFNIRKINALTTDPVNQGFQIQTGEIASSGVELDIIGSPVDGLSLIANYAYTDAKIVQDTRAELVGRREQAPIHAVNLWATYRLSQGALKGLGVSFGASYLAQRYVLTQGLTNAVQQGILPDFQKLDLALSYTIENYSVALNVDNVTNANNLLGVLNRNLNSWIYMTTPGANWRITLGAKF